MLTTNTVPERPCESGSNTTFVAVLSSCHDMVADIEKMSDDINETLTGSSIPYPSEKKENEGLMGSFEDLYYRLSRVRKSLMIIGDTIK